MRATVHIFAPLLPNQHKRLEDALRQIGFETTLHDRRDVSNEHILCQITDIPAERFPNDQSVLRLLTQARDTLVDELGTMYNILVVSGKQSSIFWLKLEPRPMRAYG